MTGTIPKFELRLNEESEINFKVSIEGSSSDSEMSAPKFRFVMTEAGAPEGHGWLFPAKNEGNDIISVKIPSMKEGIRSGKKYHGKLEVLMGNLLVVPTEVVVEFTRPLQIEATPIITKKEGVSVLTAEAVVPASKKQDVVVKKNTQAGMAMDRSLMEEEDIPTAPAPEVGSSKEEEEDDKEEVAMAESVIRPPEPPTKPPVRLSEAPKKAPVAQVREVPRRPPVATRTPTRTTLTEAQEKELLKKRLQDMFRSALVGK